VRMAGPGAVVAEKSADGRTMIIVVAGHAPRPLPTSTARGTL
jgi:hypothetical protein